MLFKKKVLLCTWVIFIFIAKISYALPFNIVPKSGTRLPTQVRPGDSVNAFYTVTNMTRSITKGNYVKYFPDNVKQITANYSYPDACKNPFALQPQGKTGNSCTLELTVSGPVNGNDPDPHKHLFICFPGGTTCAGTHYPLNVSVVTSVQVAVGSYLSANTSKIVPMIAWSSNAGASWLQKTLPVADDYQNGFLNGVFCHSSTCIAVGYYDSALSDATIPAMMVSRDQGQSWSERILPPFPSGFLAGVTCVNKFCIAVGGLVKADQRNYEPAILRSTDGGEVWSQKIVALTEIQSGYLTSIVCTVNTCVAIGHYQDANFNLKSIIAESKDNGNSWSIQALAFPAVDIYLNAVTCLNDYCIAVGFGEDSLHFNQYPVILSNNKYDSNWSLKILPLLSDVRSGFLKGISCTNHLCTAVGSYTQKNGLEQPLIVVSVDNAASWSQQILSLSTGLKYDDLKSVICSGSTCVAVGRHQDMQSGSPAIAVSKNSGTSWSHQILNPPSGYYQGIFNAVM